PRDRLRDRRGVAGGDGTVAGPAERGRGGEPSGGPGRGADCGAAGCAGGAASDPGDDQPDRERPERDATGDGPRDAVARRGRAPPLVCGGSAASRGQVPTGEGTSGDASPPQGSRGPGPGAAVWNRA